MIMKSLLVKTGFLKGLYVNSVCVCACVSVSMYMYRWV